MKPSGGRRAQGREPPGEAARPSRGGAERHVEEGFVTDESSLLSPGTAHVKIVGTFSRSRRHSGSIPAQSRIWEAEDRQTGPTAGSGDRAPLSSVWAGTTPAELPRRRRHGTFAASLRRRARTALCVPPPPGTAGLTAPPVPALVAARCGRDPRAGDPGEGARPPAECPGNQDAVPCPWGRAGAPQGLSTQGPARGGVRPLAWAPRRTRLLCPPPLRSAPRSAGPEPREPLTSGNPPLPRKCPSTRSVF